MNAPASPLHRSAYDQRFAPLLYDLLVACMFAPFGGIRRMRRVAVERLELQPGTRVLELGCGTGSVTQLLCATGADVTAIDGSANMLARARLRAPAARFVQQRLEILAPPYANYDCVFAGFVLHELPAHLRASVLSATAQLLAHDGVLAILDHSVPQARLFARGWRALLLRLEPASVRSVIEQGYASALAASGFAVVEEKSLAAGTARLWIARRR